VRSALESSQDDTFPVLIATYPNDERRIMALGVTEEVLEHYAVRRVSWRLSPLLFFLYLIASIDRSNVAFAALQMNHDLGFSASAYGFGAGIFFVGYCLLEIPRNLILVRVGARRWISRIMISWGIITCAMMLIHGRVSFYTLRFCSELQRRGSDRWPPCHRSMMRVVSSQVSSGLLVTRPQSAASTGTQRAIINGKRPSRMSRQASYEQNLQPENIQHAVGGNGHILMPIHRKRVGFELIEPPV
jgi:hypothetical protein